MNKEKLWRFIDAIPLRSAPPYSFLSELSACSQFRPPRQTPIEISSTRGLITTNNSKQWQTMRMIKSGKRCEVFADMNNALALWIALISIAICTLTSCGSSKAPAQLLIQLSPSAPSLAINLSIAVNAQTTPPLPKYLGWLTWSI